MTQPSVRFLFYKYMSDHMSFTSEYIYCAADYKKIREALEKEAGGKWFDIFQKWKIVAL